MVAENSDIASLYSAGKTFENRNLNVIVLKKASSKRKVWIGIIVFNSSQNCCET